MQREIATALNTPDIHAKLLQAGIEPDGSSSSEFAAYVKAEVAKWRKVIANARMNKI